MFAKKSISRIVSVLLVVVFMLTVTPFQAAHAAGTRYAKPVATGGDELWVMAGTHTPATGTDRSATFQLKSSVAIYGGFAPSATLRLTSPS